MTRRYIYVHVTCSGISGGDGSSSPLDHDYASDPMIHHTMTDKTELMTIREMCDAFEVTPRTLRFYEQKELLFPIRQGTKRLFTRRDRARLKLILRGRRFGFSLEDIRQLLDMYDRAPDQQEAQLRRTYELARARLREMEQQRDELQEAITELKDQMAWGEQILVGFRRSGAA